MDGKQQGLVPSKSTLSMGKWKPERLESSIRTISRIREKYQELMSPSKLQPRLMAVSMHFKVVIIKKQVENYKMITHSYL